ncbi:hypothetical protein F350042L8_01750 [Fusobacterium ulcerans]|uniref:metallophosphoesterase n=1 Tax=Fusobacterium ulcerans TaxID=861 RepID=UPI0034A8305D
MSFFRIMHMSDIHIGNTYKKIDEILYQTIMDIDSKKLCEINCIVVTGDIFEGKKGNDEKLIEEAANFFNLLLLEINKHKKNKKLEKIDILFVPGNHDLIRTTIEKKQWEKYKKFLEKFYKGIPNFYEEDFSFFKKYEEEKVVFLGFNSCKIEKNDMNTKVAEVVNSIENVEFLDCDIKNKIINSLKNLTEEYDDYGFINIKQIYELRKKLTDLKDRNEYNIIGVFHHHFSLFPEIVTKFGDSSVIRNHATIIGQLKEMKVKTILHGHKHFDLERPYISEDYYETTNNIIDVFSAGSFSSNLVEQHIFSLIDIYDIKDEIKLKQHKFIYRGEKSVEVNIKQIPPQNNKNEIIDLENELKEINYEMYFNLKKIFQANIEYERIYNDIVKWLNNLLKGFDNFVKQLRSNDKNIVILIYSIYYRVLRYKYYISQFKDINCAENIKVLEAFFKTKIKKDEQYLEILNEIELSKMAASAKKKFLNIENKKEIAYILLASFFTDFYLVMTQHADKFKAKIEHKINIRTKENEFHKEVPASSIILKSDIDRRSVNIDMYCTKANTHKVAVLFIKEFELFLNNFEEFFKEIEIKIYYICPKIKKDEDSKLENYNFEAYIPTLLPLLTGENIYSNKLTFIRELIQNSIDAISVRKAKDPRRFNEKILIETGIDKQKRRYFRIKDNGIGMNRYTIERYFTSIGRSFYSSDDYRDLNINYKPISNFGIGFLSSFMVCKEIEVITKYALGNENENLKLHIPNYDGCFFIEKIDNIEIGTEIKLYLTNILKNEEIYNYIKYNILDIDYDIEIIFKDDNNDKEEKVLIEKISKKKIAKKNYIFIPFNDSGEILQIENYEKEIIEEEYKSKYKYGLLIYDEDEEYKKQGSNMRRSPAIAYHEKYFVVVLNAGIRVARNSILSHKKHYYNSEEYDYNMVINFPSNWLKLNVSRESISDYSDNINEKEMVEKLKIVFYAQVEMYLKYLHENNQDITLKELDELISKLLYFNRNEELNLEQLYSMTFICEKNEIKFEIKNQKIDFYTEISNFLIFLNNVKAIGIDKFIKENISYDRESFDKKTNYLEISINLFIKTLSKLDYDIISMYEMSKNKIRFLTEKEYHDFFIFTSIPEASFIERLVCLNRRLENKRDYKIERWKEKFNLELLEELIKFFFEFKFYFRQKFHYFKNEQKTVVYRK